MLSQLVNYDTKSTKSSFKGKGQRRKDLGLFGPKPSVACSGLQVLTSSSLLSLYFSSLATSTLHSLLKDSRYRQYALIHSLRRRCCRYPRDLRPNYRSSLVRSLCSFFLSLPTRNAGLTFSIDSQRLNVYRPSISPHLLPNCRRSMSLLFANFPRRCQCLHDSILQRRRAQYRSWIR